MTQLPPYTEDDLDYLKICRIDPWRHDGRNFERDYSQYSKRAYVARPTLPGRLVGCGIVAALIFAPFIVWSLVQQ